MKPTQTMLNPTLKLKSTKGSFRKDLTAYLIISPWLLGFFGLVIGR